MKNHLLLIATLFCTSLVFAQEPQTLFGNRHQTVSGFGGFQLGFQNLGSDFVTTSGGGGGIILNNSFFLGGWGEGLSTDIRITESASDPTLGEMDYYVDYGHGGLWSGFLIRPDQMIHFGASVKVGWGNLDVSRREYFPGDEAYPRDVSDNYLLIRPHGEVELNMTHWFKLNFGVGYQFVNGLDNYFYGPNDMTGMNYTLSFLFGWFR